MVCVRTLGTSSARPDFVSLESDKTSFRRIRAEIETFVALGYDRFQAIEQSEIPTSQAPPPLAREGVYSPHRFALGSSGLFGEELDGRWRTAPQILRYYRLVRLGYLLLGDDGVMTRWHFRGSRRLREATRWLIGRGTGAVVPGWYDTHARRAPTL